MRRTNLDVGRVHMKWGILTRRRGERRWVVCTVCYARLRGMHFVHMLNPLKPTGYVMHQQV
jgi:hypothetical protein